MQRLGYLEHFYIKPNYQFTNKKILNVFVLVKSTIKVSQIIF